MTTKHEPGLLNKPLRLLVITAVSFFALEVLIMFLISRLPRLSVETELLLDAVVLTGTGTIVLYYFLFRPVKLHMNERMKAEEALTLAYKELQQIFQTAADGMRLIDREFNTVKVNQTFAEIVGLAKEEITGRKCYEIFPGPQCHTIYCPMYRIINGEEKIEYESPKERLDGTTVSCIITATPLRDSDGELAGIVEDFKDISARKQMEEDLHQAKERYQRIIEDVPDFLCRFTPDGTITFLNDAYARFFNKPKEELTGTRFFKNVPADKYDELYRVVDSLSIDNAVVNTEVEVISPDGLLRWQSWRCRALFDNGQIAEIQAIGRDITERRQMELALRESEQRFRTIFNEAPDGILVMDSNTREFVIANESICRKLGYSGDELKKLTVSDIHPANELQYVLQELQKIIAGSITFIKDIPVKRKNGAVFFADISTVWLTLDGKKYLMGFFRDVSERKKTEDEQLRMQKLESLGILAGGIAHDFNNILTAILGNISYIRLFTDPENEIFQPLIMAEQASLRARPLTHMLMTFSKGGEPVKKIISLSKLLRESTRLVLSGSKVRSGFVLKDDLLSIEADEGQINQVFNNIILNAVQSMPDGGTVRIFAENTFIEKDTNLPLTPGRFVKVSVSDEGAGITHENLRKIFDPYFTTKKSSSGLGLTIAYYIVQKHRGYILAESEPGEGAVFTVYLPACESKVSVEKKGNVYCPLGKGRVLIMDDEDILKDFVCRLLRRIGYEVRTASDGVEAIEMYKAAKESGEPFDILILDLTIAGGMGGKETIRCILEFDPAAKAIVSSGYSDDPVMANYAEHGFKGVVMKPYSIEELSSAIAEVIAAR